jgi:diketogulonate reductase-like aldo/keto reductase
MTFGRRTGLRVSEYALGTATFGTSPSAGTGREDARTIFNSFAEAGGTFIDTADHYQGGQSETVLGELLVGDRDHFVVGTKYTRGSGGSARISETGNSRKTMRRSLEASLKRLGTEYVDLYLIHWPAPARDRYVDSWKALIRLRDEWRVRSIGVSNFQPPHIERLLAETGVLPTVNQIELHPDFGQRELVAFHARHHIVTEAWSPLGRGGELLEQPILTALAQKHNKTPAQIVLRWHIQRGHMVIPKSQTPARIRSNIAIFDFALSEQEMALIDTLEAGNRMGPDPDSFNPGGN